jgi:transposase-like protein
VVPLFAFPPAIRKMIYTTNAVESLHRSLRKIIKTRGQLSHRRGGAQTAVSGDPQCRPPLASAD